MKRQLPGDTAPKKLFVKIQFVGEHRQHVGINFLDVGIYAFLDII
jgi:hypothetical protein